MWWLDQSWNFMTPAFSRGFEGVCVWRCARVCLHCTRSQKKAHWWKRVDDKLPKIAFRAVIIQCFAWQQSFVTKPFGWAKYLAGVLLYATLSDYHHYICVQLTKQIFIIKLNIFVVFSFFQGTRVVYSNIYERDKFCNLFKLDNEMLVLSSYTFSIWLLWYTSVWLLDGCVHQSMQRPGVDPPFWKNVWLLWLVHGYIHDLWLSLH